MAILNERANLSQYSRRPEDPKALFEAKYIAKGILKMMQSIAAVDAITLNLELMEPLLSICQFLSVKILEIGAGVPADEDTIVYVFQILKGQHVEDSRMRSLLQSLAYYLRTHTFTPQDTKFYDTILLFIASMEHYQSSYSEVAEILYVLSSLLTLYLKSANAPLFDAAYASRAKRYGFSSHVLRYALRNLSSSCPAVVGLVLTLRPWLEEYGDQRWDVESAGRSLLGLRRMREPMLLMGVSDSPSPSAAPDPSQSMLEDFGDCVRRYLCTPFHDLQLKESFLHQVGKWLSVNHEKDDAYAFLVEELTLWLTRNSPESLPPISLPAWAGLLHGMGRRGHWFEQYSREFMIAAKAHFQSERFSQLLSGQVLEQRPSDGAQTGPSGGSLVSEVGSPSSSAHDVLHWLCGMISGFESVAVPFAAILSTADIWMTAVLALIRSGAKPTYTQAAFLCRGLTGLFLASGHEVILEVMDRVFAEMNAKDLTRDQCCGFLSIPGFHFFLERLRRDGHQRSYRNVFSFIAKGVTGCQSIKQLSDWMGLLPRIDPTGCHDTCQVIIQQLAGILLDDPSVQDLLELVSQKQQELRAEMRMGAHSAFARMDDHDAGRGGSKKERANEESAKPSTSPRQGSPSSVDWKRALVEHAGRLRSPNRTGNWDPSMARTAVHLLGSWTDLVLPAATRRKGLVVLLSHALSGVLFEVSPGLWREFLSFCSQFPVSHPDVSFLTVAVQSLHKDILSRSVQYLAALSGRWSREVVARVGMGNEFSESPRMAVPHSLALEQLVYPDGSQLFVDCVVSLTSLEDCQLAQHADILSAVQYLWKAIYQGSFGFMDTMWHCLYSNRYLGPVVEAWRDVEQGVISHVEKRLTEAPPSAWRTAVSYALVQGLPALIAIELRQPPSLPVANSVRSILSPTAGERWDPANHVAGASYEEEQEEQMKSDGVQEFSHWLAIDILPKNRYLAQPESLAARHPNVLQSNFQVTYKLLLLESLDQVPSMLRYLDQYLADYGLK